MTPTNIRVGRYVPNPSVLQLPRDSGTAAAIGFSQRCAVAFPGSCVFCFVQRLGHCSAATIRQSIGFPFRFDLSRGGSNPELSQRISPDLSPDLNPRLNLDLNLGLKPELTPGLRLGLTPELGPELTPPVAPSLKPGFNRRIDPELARSVRPDVAGGVTPGMTPRLNPALNPAVLSHGTGSV